MPDYLPTADTEFIAWMQNFLSYASANVEALGLTEAELTPIQNQQSTLETSYTDFVATQALAASKRQRKDDERTAQEKLVRPLVARLQSFTTVTDAQRQALGVKVRSTSRTAAPTPESRPIATIDTSMRLRHTISFMDENTTGSRAKPAGVSGCEIWVKVGEPSPAGPDEMRYVATDTRSPYVLEFAASDAGKMAYYMLRWVNTRGARGPWSRTVGGTITN
jgi:hypothetical protein